jgi:SAM-dependent methyltransferase
MNSPDLMARLFDAKAADFDGIYSRRKNALRRAWDRLTRRNIHDRLAFALDRLEPVAGKTILDAGCGSGRYCVELARRGAARAVGLDLSPRMLAMARALADAAGVGGRCDFIEGDVLGFAPAERFDAVVAMGFFDYVAAQGEMLRRLAALSRGPIVASFPCLWAWRIPARWLWWKRKGWTITLSTRRQLLALCAASGLEVVELKREGPLYLLVATPADQGLPAAN